MALASASLLVLLILLGCTPWPESHNAVEDVQRVNEGMSKREVWRIMGPEDHETHSGIPEYPECWFWDGKKDRVAIVCFAGEEESGMRVTFALPWSR